jgi:DNA-directed RNA polymerase subunit delta
MGCGKVSQMLTLTPEQAEEMAMVDIAHMLLSDRNEPVTFLELMNEIAKIKNLSEEEAQQSLVHLYTEINVDGRFVCIGNNTWGLKKWYPVEQFDEAAPAPVKGKKRVLDEDYEDLDDYDDLEDDYIDDYDEDYVDDEVIDVDYDEDEEVEIEIDEEFEDEEVVLDFEEDESLEELAEEEELEEDEEI